MLLRLSCHLINVFLFPLGRCTVPILQLLFQLLDLLNQTLCVLLLHVCIFSKLLCCDAEFDLQFLSTAVSLSDHPLVLSQVSLQVIHGGLSLLHSDQSAKLIIKLDLFLFKQ